MHLEMETARQILSNQPNRVHLMGIGGVGMAALAFQLFRAGWRVSGCDLRESRLTAWLRKNGIPVACGHAPRHAEQADWFVRSTAVGRRHPEIMAAQYRKIPVLRRGIVLSALMEKRASIIVCGTHGKTTTTAMLVRALRAARRAPDYCIGGDAPRCAVAGAGREPLMVAEADESDGTLAVFAPDIAVITNIEFDHAEHYADMPALLKCFAQLRAQVKQSIIYCADDSQSARLLARHPRAVSFGFAQDAEWRAKIVSTTSCSTAFAVEHQNRPLGVIKLPVTGTHNVLNALAACAAASAYGAPFTAIRKGLNGFLPVRRRFEKVFERKGLCVISDYAHHPTEIKAGLNSFQHIRSARHRVVFQPHRYSRTKAMGREFAEILQNLDELILTPVYAASEPAIAGGDIWDLYEHFRRRGRLIPLCATSLAQAQAYLCATLQRGDALLALGAGDVDQIARRIKTIFARRNWQTVNPTSAWHDALRRLPLQASQIRRNEPLAGKTTLRVGGSADLFAEIGCLADLKAVLATSACRAIPYSILGAGSNVLVSDLGVRGLTMRLFGPDFRTIRMESPNCVVAGAGVSLRALTAYLAKHGRSGLEFLTGIPGTVGGALRMNAGAWGKTIGARTRWAHYLDRQHIERQTVRKKLQFGYRCARALQNAVIIEAAFDVEPAAARVIRATTSKIQSQRTWLSGRQSAGSIFKNPAGDFAGRLLEKAGMKGRRIGGAQFIKAHANVIATMPNACAADVRALIEIARRATMEYCGVTLEEEIKYLE